MLPMKTTPLPHLHVRTLLVVLAFGSIFVLNFLGSTDPDFWWHLRTGQYIFDTRSIPQQDIYSYTALGKPWVTHEWLSELAIYLVNRPFGYVGNVILFGVVATATFFVIFRLLRRLAVNELLALGLVFWALFLTLRFWTVRPQLFSWLLFAVFFHQLHLYHRGETNRLWHLPLLLVLWVNLHSGYILGPVLIGLLLLARLANRLFYKETARPGHLSLILLLSLIACLVNPHGLATLIYPFTYAGTENASMLYIIEWQSPNFHEYYWLLLVAGLFLLMVLGIGNGRFDFWTVLLTFGLTWAALRSMRNVPFYAIGLAPLLGERLCLRYAFARSSPRTAQSAAKSAVNWLLLLAIALAVAISLPGWPQAQVQREPLISDRMPYPVAGVDYLKQHYPEARLFNEYAWGGYLIQTLYPQIPVFIDGRADVYGDAFVREYAAVMHLEPQWQDVLDRYQVEVIIIAKDSPLSVALSLSPQWENVFTGPVEEIFVKEGIQGAG
jgi:hypothetical protein